MRPLLRLRLALFLIFPISCPPLLHAQANPAASRNLSAQAFTGIAIVNTDRGQTNPGFTLGGDLGYYIGHGFVPAVEARIKFAPGSPYGENTFGGGINIQHRLRHAQVYGNFLWSYGTISEALNDKTIHDDSVVYSPGGGLDFSINESLAARIDYQYEYWHTGKGVSFNPQAITFGIVYRFPLRPYVSH
jgi:opacity protein-like surface antigen